MKKYAQYVMVTPKEDPPLSRRTNFVTAAMQGVMQMASQYGAAVASTDRGFRVVFKNGDEMHFDAMEM